MSVPTGPMREGSLQAPTRHALDWNSAEFYNEDALHQELERVYDICHGCRRCVLHSQRHAGPRLPHLPRIGKPSRGA